MRGRGQGWGMLTVKLLMFTWLERRSQTQTIPHSNIQFQGNNFTHSLKAIQSNISISVPLGWQMNNVLLNNTQLKCKESFTAKHDIPHTNCCLHSPQKLAHTVVEVTISYLNLQARHHNVVTSPKIPVLPHRTGLTNFHTLKSVLIPENCSQKV